MSITTCAQANNYVNDQANRAIAQEIKQSRGEREICFPIQKPYFTQPLQMTELAVCYLSINGFSTLNFQHFNYKNVENHLNPGAKRGKTTVFALFSTYEKLKCGKRLSNYVSEAPCPFCDLCNFLALKKLFYVVI